MDNAKPKGKVVETGEGRAAPPGASFPEESPDEPQERSGDENNVEREEGAPRESRAATIEEVRTATFQVEKEMRIMIVFSFLIPCLLINNFWFWLALFFLIIYQVVRLTIIYLNTFGD